MPAGYKVPEICSMLTILTWKGSCFTQYRNGWLAASDLFNMFTQSINFHTFHYQYRCLKNVIHQIKDVKELSSLTFLIKYTVKMDGCSFHQFYSKIWVSFCLNTGKRFSLEVPCDNHSKF